MRLPVTLKELSRKSSLYCLDVEKHFLTFFPDPQNKIFLLAFSGGKDSTALTVIMNILARRNNFSLQAIHINHKLRPDSRLDSIFAKEICSILKIPLQCVSFDLLKYAAFIKCGEEEAGHLARRRLFCSRASEISADAILVAHHAGDLEEDVILRLIRGSSWPALAGMNVKTENIFRPLLVYSAESIKSFLIRENIPWREDSTNNYDKYRRNRIRHHFIPLFHSENPSWEKTLVNINKLADIDREYWQNLINKFFKNITILATENNCSVLIPRKCLKEQPKALRLRIYAEIIKKINMLFQISGQGRSSNFFLLDDALMNDGVNKTFQFPGNISFLLASENIMVKAQK